MRVSFHLRPELKSKKTNLIPISILVSHQGKKIRKKIPGLATLEKDWIKAQQRIAPNKKNESYNYSIEFNSKMEEISNRLNKVWMHHQYVLEREITIDEIKQVIDDEYKVVTDDASLSVIDCFDLFIEQSRSHRAERTIKGYTTVRNMLESFYESVSCDTTLDGVDLHFFDLLRNYCFGVKEYKNNMFARVVTNIKTLMRWAEDRGYHKNQMYLKFKASEEDIEVIYLTMEELMKLYTFDFKSDKLDRVRDLYCFSAFTGLRYSDLSSLRDANVKGDYLNITVKKTKSQDHIIPLNKFAKEILKKYKDDFQSPLPVISSQKLNKYIKEACEIVEINEPVIITRFSGNKRIETTEPKYKLITIHTARKTFITNSLVIGMNQTVVKKISNHKSDTAFRKYYKVADDIKKREMNKWDEL